MTEYLVADLLDVSLKSVVLIAAAWLATSLMMRRSAAERHMVWTLTVVAMLAMPLVGAFAPRLSVSISPVRALTFLTDALAPGVPGLQGEAALRLQADPNDLQATNSSAAAPQTSAPLLSAGEVMQNGDAPTSEAADFGLSGANVLMKLRQSAEMFSQLRVRDVLLGMWLSGCIVFLTRFVFVHRHVHRHLSRLQEFNDANVRAAVEKLRIDQGIRRRVRVMRSKLAHSPWTCGWLRPVMVLPASFTDWPAAAQRRVLMHEFAHIRRNDHLIGALTQFCCAAYWFNPLVWLVARNVRLESEKAADDCVLAGGEPASDYAEQLLHIANRVFAERGQSVWIPAMAHRSSLSPRVRSILDTNNRRTAMNRFNSSVLALTALFIVVPLATLQSEYSVAQETVSADAINSTEFLQIVSKGPSGSGELEHMVNVYVANNRVDEAADVMARFMTNDYGIADEHGCTYCQEIMSTEGLPRRHEKLPVMIAALDLIEQRADREKSGDVLLQTVLENVVGSGSRIAMSRASYFVMRAIQIGISEQLSGAVVSFLAENGNTDAALELARQLHDTDGSAHYQSEGMAQWVKYLEGEVRRRETLARMIVDSLGYIPAASNDEYLPITKTPPVYPVAAADQGLEGHVIVEFTVGTDGKPSGISVVESSDRVFNQSAVAAAQHFRYAPRLVGGSPVAVPGVRNRIAYRLE